MAVILSTPDELTEFDGYTRVHPNGSLWQSLAWKQYQEAIGREVRCFVLRKKGALSASALVQIDRTVGGFTVWDIPRGPIGEGREELLQAILEQARTAKALALFCSPPLPLQGSGLNPSPRHEQPEATRIIDLTRSEEDILAQMKPKGRYNISVARKHAVEVDRSDDITAFHALQKETGQRDAFSPPPRKNIEAFLKNLPGSFLLLASVQDNREPIAGLLGIVWGSQGIYYYGASSYASRALMAPYALQWEAMNLCKAQGALTYDLLGIAPPGSTSHAWSGVSAFKEKFGGSVVLYPPEQCAIVRPWHWRGLQWKRKLLG